MRSAIEVASPPAKPLMVYDGDCKFCTLWVRRWEHTTEGRLDYLPFQDPQVSARFPEVPRGQFETAVQLIETDGRVYGGGEAVFRSLAHKPHGDWLLDWYERSQVFAGLSEWAYGRVARHRTLFSVLTRLAWDGHVEPPTHHLVRWVFLRALGLIYLIAFVSLGVQIIGLVGSNGLLPANDAMAGLRQAADAQHLGLNRFHLVPTLCWFNASDGFLRLQCAAGAALAIVLLLGIAPALCLFLMWLIYLSLTTIGRDFLSFQWDSLLLETGFLAIFLAPLQLGPRWSSAAPPPRLVLWLLRWLLFKLMFQSGCVKLLSGDPTARNLTLLTYHYETQPLPTWIGWYAFQLPAWVQKACAATMFGIELFLPFLIVAPRRPRQVACGVLLGFHTLIFLTGNYGFFNLLAMALCVLLLDDAGLKALLSARLRGLFAPGRRASPRAPTSPENGAREDARPPVRRWPVQVTVPLAAIALATALIQFSAMFHVRGPWPRPLLAAYVWLEPLRSFNSYGLFAVMTTTRPEIILEGSDDGVNWRAYEFKYKPGDLKRRPGFVEPHQPRLDWQMWFASLGSYRQNPWLVNLCVRLLQGAPPVLGLLEGSPFSTAPPRYIRAVLYRYHFTDPATHRKTGAWWRRQEEGIYLPAFSLGDLHLQQTDA